MSIIRIIVTANSTYSLGFWVVIPLYCFSTIVRVLSLLCYLNQSWWGGGICVKVNVMACWLFFFLFVAANYYTTCTAKNNNNKNNNYVLKLYLILIYLYQIVYYLSIIFLLFSIWAFWKCTGFEFKIANILNLSKQKWCMTL